MLRSFRAPILSLGALLGLVFLALSWPAPPAEADPLGRCAPGRNCSVRSLKATAGSGATAIDMSSGGRFYYGTGANEYFHKTTTNRLGLPGGIRLDEALYNGSAGSFHIIGTNAFRLVRAQVDAVDVASIAAGTCNDSATTVTFTGTAFATASTACTVTGSVAGIASDVVPYAWASDATTVVIRLCCNNGASACDPASQNYTVTCIQ